MTGIQVVTVAAAFVMAYASYVSLKRSELRVLEFSVWMAVWLGLALVSLFPDRLRVIIAPLAVARLLDLVMICGLLFLSIVVFNLNRAIRRLDNRLRALVQRLALAEARDHLRDAKDGREIDAYHSCKDPGSRATTDKLMR